MKALEITNLHKTYGNGFTALNGITLSVEEGDFFALLGPNGAGKSTTLGIVSSLVNKTSGEVKVFGHSLDNELIQAKNCLGVVPQEFNFNQFEKVQDILYAQAGFYGIPANQAKTNIEKYLKLLDLWDKRDEVSRLLSGGMKRRLMIARALIHDPKLLILDEPTAGVDIELRRSMWEFLIDLNKQGVTIILTTHYLEEAESLCRNIAIINAGEIVNNSSMKALLGQLNKETFVLDLKSNMEKNPILAGFETRLVDEVTLEIDVETTQTLNDVFTALSEQNVLVRSMKTKANRLEEMFVNLVAK
jgi:ABC-2 type transport system ATP-binding protein